MASQPLSPPPSRSPLTSSSGLLAPDWARWFQQLWDATRAPWAEPWQTPTLLNGWTASGGQPPRFTRLRTGQVFVEGGVAGGSFGGAHVFVLPPGYCPGEQSNFTTESNGAFGRLIVQADGAVIPYGASNVYVSVACTFLAGG